MEFLRRMWQTVYSFFDNLTFNQKLSLLMVAGSMVLAFIVLLMLGGGERYVGVGGPYDAETLAAAQGALRNSAIPFKVQNGQIRVKRSRVDEALGAIAYQAGREAVSFSFEDLVKQEGSFWQTSEERRMRLLVALQNRMASYVRQFPGVKSASVTLNIPRERLRMTSRDLGSASVVFKTYSGEELALKDYYAIARTVAGAHRLLKPDRVVVTNQSTGRSPRIPKSDEVAEDAFDRLKAQKATARMYEEQLQGLFDKLGPQNVVVRVFPEVEWKTEVIDEKIPDPKRTIVEKKKESEESRSTRDGGNVGVTPNTGVNVRGGQSGQNTFLKKEKSEPVTIAEAIKHVWTKKGPGEVTGARVAVIVNSLRVRELAKQEPGVTADDGKVDETKLAAAETKLLDSLKSLVVFPSLKTEHVQFKAIPFARAAPVAAGVPAQPVQIFLKDNLGLIGLLLLGLLAVILVFTQARKAVPEPELPEIPELMEAESALAAAMETPQDEKTARLQKMLDAIRANVEANPTETAGLLRKWVSRES